MKITIKFYYNDEEVIHDFPSKKEVCWDCEGHGTHLAPGIREHAYSAEEFYEAFHNEEDREEYFAHGGKYDVICHTCKGLRVIDVLDNTALRPEDKEAFEQYLVYQKQEAEFRREQEFERRMGC